MIQIDMELPKSCSDCCFSSCKGRLGEFYCDITTYDVDMESDQRDINCPLKVTTNRDAWRSCQKMLNDLSAQMEEVSPMGVRSELEEWWDKPYKEGGENGNSDEDT